LGFASQAVIIDSHFLIVAGENVAENWLNTSVCFALILNASLKRLRNNVPVKKRLKVSDEKSQTKE
jgi:hypothetical protein